MQINMERVFALKNVRLFFKKGGPLRFVSHLDMNRVMTRVLRLSKVPVWYTEGFNPHPYITFALPLSLGFSSDYEVMDFRLDDDSFDMLKAKQMIADACPDGIEVIALKEPKLKAGKIAFATFDITFLSEANATLKTLKEFLSAKEIIVSKTTKKGGVKEIDLAKKLGPFTLGGDENNPKILSLTLPAGGEDNVNPKLLIDAYIGVTGGKRDFYKINRTSLLTADLNKFE